VKEGLAYGTANVTSSLQGSYTVSALVGQLTPMTVGYVSVGANAPSSDYVTVNWGDGSSPGTYTLAAAQNGLIRLMIAMNMQKMARTRSLRRSTTSLVLLHRVNKARLKLAICMQVLRGRCTRIVCWRFQP